MARRATCLLSIAATCASQSIHAADCPETELVGGYVQSREAPALATCTTYLSETGTVGTSCYWPFAFRDDAALGFSDELWTELTSCIPGVAGEDDQLVNHPDSYSLRLWQTPAGTYAISVKDKGALDQTLVFLRFEPK